MDKATAIREKQLAEFNAEEKDLLQSIGALKSAIVVLSKHHEGFLQGRHGGRAFIQSESAEHMVKAAVTYPAARGRVEFPRRHCWSLT